LPKLSVRIPTLNNYSGLLRAVKSILFQEYDDYDLIIVDNNSDDGSWTKIQSLSLEYPHIKIMQNKQRGLAENWNYCIQTATSENLLIFHHDDEMLPGMMQKSIKFLTEHPRVGFVHTNCYDVNDLGQERLRITQNRPILIAGVEALTKIVSDCNIACSSVVVRSECYNKLGKFILNNPSPDAEMWARIVRLYDMGHINEPLVKVYIRMDSSGDIILREGDPKAIAEQWKNIGEKIIKYFPIEDQIFANRLSKISGFKAFTTAAYIAWKYHHWKKGHEYMILAGDYANPIKWLLKYIEVSLRVLYNSAKFVLFKTFILKKENL